MSELDSNDPTSDVTQASSAVDTVNSKPRPVRRGVVRALQVLLAIVVLAGAWLGMRWMMNNRVDAKRRKPKTKATLVQVTPVKISTYRIAVKAMGLVRAAHEVTLKPRVKGEILSLDRRLIPGGLVPKGQVLLRIDASDYRVAVRQSASAVKLAQADVQVEKGRQASVKKELQLVGSSAKGVNRDLVLRGPQLRKVQAAVESAKAALRRAHLDLSRTVIRSPFNAVVLSRDVSIGTRVTESVQLARLVGTDAFWVELVIPVDQLRWIRFPGAAGELGASVRVRDPAWDKGQARTGRVIQLMPDLEQKGRMARLLVKVDDPMALQKANLGRPRLLIGSWIEATIEGRELKGVAVVPRRLMRNGAQVWLIDSRGRLDIRTVVVAFRGPEHVVVSEGLQQGERLVASDISTPVKGTVLRVLKKRARSAKEKRP